MNCGSPLYFGQVQVRLHLIVHTCSAHKDRLDRHATPQVRSKHQQQVLVVPRLPKQLVLIDRNKLSCIQGIVGRHVKRFIPPLSFLPFHFLPFHNMEAPVNAFPTCDPTADRCHATPFLQRQAPKPFPTAPAPCPCSTAPIHTRPWQATPNLRLFPPLHHRMAE